MADGNNIVIGKASPEVVGEDDREEALNPDADKNSWVDTYSTFVASRPFCTCAGAFALVTIIILVLILVNIGDLVEIDFSLESAQVRGNVISDRKFALEAADCGGHCPEDRRLGGHWHYDTLTMAYVSKDEKNILSESRLKQALSLERKVAAVLGEPIHTELQRYFPSYPADSGAVGGGALQSLLVSVAEEVKDSRNKGNFAWPHYDKNFSACTPQSQLISSVFRDARDFETFENELSDLETDDVFATFFWTLHSWTDERFWFPEQRDAQIGKDTLLIIGVLFTAVIIIGVQTRSFLLAVAGLLSILFATGVAFSLYRGLVSKWFGVLNAFSIFLLLGIACDDIFVVSDAWRQAVETMGIAPDDYRRRVHYVVMHSFMAITTTSLTTAGAFFGNAISKIPPLRLFGVFAGFMVLADWILTLLVLPAVLVLQHHLFGHWKCGSRGTPVNSPRWIDKFLTQSFSPRLFKAAPVLVILFTLIIAVMLNIALEMPPGAAFHESDLFPDDHVQRRAYRAQQAMANLEPEYAYLQIIYGVKPEDTGDMNNPKTNSEAVWDDSFDAYKAQQFTFELCNDLLAQRGMVRRLDACWAQDVQSRLAMQNKPFPASSRSELNQVLWGGPGIRWSEGHTWASIGVETTIFHDSPVSELRSNYDKWEAWMQRWNEEAKRRGLPGVAHGFQTAERWHFMSTIEEYATSCIAASCISTAIVAVLLLLTLRNVVVVFLVLLNVIGVCLTLMATLVMEGRKLGVLEGIAMTLLVGLSVDYLVHVAKAYLDEPEDEPRERRTLNAISHLGGAVVAGSLTTVISAIFLCCGTITFFVTFGKFVISMILLALAFTLFSLTSSLYLFGPQNNFGRIPCPQRCKRAETAQTGHVNALTEGLDVKPFSPRTRLAIGIAVAILLVTGGAIRIGLTVDEGDVDSTACPAYSELELTFENFAVPQEKDTYRCRDFDLLPSGCTYWVTEFEPIITDGMEGLVHHMILYSIEGQMSSCPYTCFDMPNARGMDATWAVGGGKITWPEGMGYTIGGHKQSLQMHYYNHDQKPGQVDLRSGMRLKLTSTPPAVTLTLIMIGLHPFGELHIPGGMQHTLRFAECAPRLRGNVTVLAYYPHAHKLGVSVTTEVRRHRSDSSSSGMFDSEVVGDLGNAPSFDFNYQDLKLFPSGQERHLTPGDAVRVICGYNTESLRRSTHGGWGSYEEMCMTIIYAYPSENVESTSCLSDHSYSM